MQLSFWEKKNWFSNVNFTIVGSGIVGIHTALKLRERFPESKIIILEKGILPEGGSTKNAGFACIGSISELLADLKNHSEEEVVHLVEKRKNGLDLLRKNVGNKNLDYKNLGGFELFLNTQIDLIENCVSELANINKLLRPILKEDAFQLINTNASFKNIHDKCFFNPFEGQIDTGMMMQTLLKMLYQKNIFILNHTEVLNFTETNQAVDVHLQDFSFKTDHLLIANNGFAAKLTGENVVPARAQVLITKPIENLHLKGTFHLDEGFYYFRNYENRILLGGGRNLDFEAETTTKLETTEKIQQALEKLLSEVILPEQKFEIDHRWSGVMGVGNQKKPIVKSLGNRVHCGVRMGGMGVAIGSLVGTELAELIS
uniref:NAD(P)/FAD-dependent oxidoreductase n=1 Tax=Flavobacterium sp. TaxID=239 RepID=UPI00404AA1A8